MITNSTRYQKIPEVKISPERMNEVFGPDLLSWEIQMADIKVSKEIGKGAYGIVYKAVWRNQTGLPLNTLIHYN